MSKEDIGAQNASPTKTGVQSARTTAAPLTAVQHQLLAVLATKPIYGLAAKRALEEFRDEAINHGRLYPHLDRLVEQGVVAKAQRDERTNEYSLTPRGHRLPDASAAWRTDCFAGGGAQ